jgi:hypothetical protein
VQRFFSLDTLLTINTTTGAGTPVSFGAHGSGFYNGSAFSAGSISTADGSQGLVRINPATSAETLIGGPGTANALAIDSMGVAYGTTSVGERMRVELTTGNETLIANTGLAGLVAVIVDSSKGQTLYGAGDPSFGAGGGGCSLFTL